MEKIAKTLILGLGNPILSDDGVGIEIAHRIGERLSGCKDVDVIEASIGGLGILDLIVGYEKLIVIDSIKTKEGKPGELYKLKYDDFRETIHSASPHDTNFATAIEIGRQCDIDIPEQIEIYAIEIKNNSIFSEQCTPEIKKVIPRIVEKILEQSVNPIPVEIEI